MARSFIFSNERFSEIKDTDINERTPYYLVTQSTGNHGIAVIYAVQQVKKYYCKKYPLDKQKWKNIHPAYLVICI